ncbi:MAG: class I SAM-dependent methyltransferase, partial [Nitrospinota bacterium]
MATDPLPLEKFEAIYRGWEERTDLGPDIRRHMEERRRYHGMLDQALAGLPPGSRVLELGCGTAIDSCLLAGRHPEHVFFGVDIASGSLALARRAGAQTSQRLLLARGDAFRLPFRPGSFSLIFHQGLVEHFPAPEGTMRELARLLAPGGWAVISAPQAFTGYTVMKRLRILRGTWPWGWERSYTAGALMALGRGAGLGPRGRAAEGYWRSSFEPAWVLRDHYRKAHRRNPTGGRPPF